MYSLSSELALTKAKQQEHNNMLTKEKQHLYAHDAYDAHDAHDAFAQMSNTCILNQYKITKYLYANNVAA